MTHRVLSLPFLQAILTRRLSITLSLHLSARRLLLVLVLAALVVLALYVAWSRAAYAPLYTAGHGDGGGTGGSPPHTLSGHSLADASVPAWGGGGVGG